MKKINSDLKKYYRAVKRGLLGGYKDKKRLMGDLKGKINDFLDDNPKAAIYTIEKHFGTPQSIANEFNSNLTPNMIKNEKFNRRLKYSLFALAAVALIAVIILSVYVIITVYENKPAYYTTSVEDLGFTGTTEITDTTEETANEAIEITE